MRHRIASLADVPPGAAREITVGDRVLAVFNVDGKIHVLDGICSHAGGPLGEGTLHGTIVTCPWHGWQFDVSTGRHCLSTQIRQPCFPVSIEGNDIYVELP